MGILYRSQILLEQEQYEALKRIARESSQSLSEIMREIVRRYLAEQDTRIKQALQALEDLAHIRMQIQEQHGIYQGDLLAEVRAEWEQDMERVWRGEG